MYDSVCHAASIKANFHSCHLSSIIYWDTMITMEQSQLIHVSIVRAHTCFQAVEILNACSVCHGAGIKSQFSFMPLKLHHLLGYCDLYGAVTAHACPQTVDAVEVNVIPCDTISESFRDYKHADYHFSIIALKLNW
ncbi:hypothetical protein CEXT_814471 [Caerostris extrusa]|uniref:Uncharacterized protein n=1 Tax=Caerostris extrusa TaxID=172846 RepID=A0AAV4N9F7_CAEEX|nr:hypothetical protein CEXT_814471 [Caerostris extrusa]